LTRVSASFVSFSSVDFSSARIEAKIIRQTPKVGGANLTACFVYPASGTIPIKFLSGISDDHPAAS
jgi:hypothetical protein